MDFRFISRLRLACSLLLRGMLLGTALFGVCRLGLGEWEYSAGMAARGVQSSLDHLTAAGEAYPWSFTFRTAQARQLYALARKVDGVTPAAEVALSLAFRTDPAAADLASMLLGAQRAMGRCDDAAQTARLVLALAPRSELAQKLAALRCDPK